MKFRLNMQFLIRFFRNGTISILIKLFSFCAGQSEDSLDAIATLLRLPLDAFSVRDPQDDVNEYTLYTRRRLKCGTTFGPYEGRVVHEDETEGLSVIQVRETSHDICASLVQFPFPH